MANQKSILLVDDDPSVAQMLTMLLETRGYEVHIARSGKEVFNKITDTIDLILLDLVLPDKGGFEICRQIRDDQLTRQIPIIILSAKFLPEDVVEALYLGADDYLSKPFEYEELLARMEAVMRRAPLLRGSPLSVNGGEEAIICEIRKIIDEGLIEPVFQPIFFLKPFKLFGVEALGRPQTRTLLSSPELLFKAAIHYGFYHDLEMLSWKKAVECASRFLTDEKLFLNCNPYLVEGPHFPTIKALFDKSPLQVGNVVLEITERSAISDFKVFYEYLRYYREYGFKFAVDDVGGGYASLESIVETRPEVVKIDRHIVNGLNKDPFKRSIIKFIAAFCRENNILSIAEGIERKDDLEIIMDLGVDAGQGYYLCKPRADIDVKEMNSRVLSFP